MEYSKQQSSVVSIFILLCLVFIGTGTSVVKSGSGLNASFILHLGKMYNKPLLKVLGNSLQDFEKQIEDKNSKMDANKAKICQLRTCSEWSEWSKCRGDHIGAFNMTSRVRQCGVNTTQCTYPLESYKNETEYELCEVKCPGNYIETKHGFCFEYHRTTKNNSDAQAFCENKFHGHIVNINSKERSDDVVDLLERTEVTSTIWIDGYRTSVSSPWLFRHGDVPTVFSNWYFTEPSNRSDELCKVQQHGSSEWHWYDRECNNKHTFVCETISA